MIKTAPYAFLKEVKTELGKVIWPTRKEAVKLTAVVTGLSVAVGFFIGALDYIFTKMMELILRR